MGHTYFRKIVFSSSLLLSLQQGFSQPFVDILNTSFQSLSTVYKNDTLGKNKTNNVYLNITLPLKLDSQNTVIVRFYGERLISRMSDYYASWYSNTS